MSGAQLMWDALADAEREIQKLYRLLVRALCDCRKSSLVLPLEPHKHTLTCKYRRSITDER